MHIFYQRHFLLLTAFAVCIVAADGAHLTPDISAAFALYGALHAIAIVVGLRRPEPFWRKCAFVIIAAALSAMAVHAGGFAGRWIARPASGVGLYWVFAAASLTGAAAYGIELRQFGYVRLTPTAIAGIAGACVLATEIAVFVLVHTNFLGPWWLALIWWYAFSAALGCCDRTARRASSTDA